MNAVIPRPADVFTRYFEVGIADTDALRQLIYRVRYRVYCEEFGFETREDHPDFLEQDEFDSYSTHCYVRHKATGGLAACVRLVNGDDDRQLPMETFCEHAIDSNYLELMRAGRSGACEISRLAVASEYRRRRGENKTRYGNVPDTDVSEAEQRSYALVAVAAYLAACAAASLTGRPTGFAMMEPFLPRLLSRSGIDVTSIGHAVDYHGQRAPYMMNVDTVLNGIDENLRVLYEEIYASFSHLKLVDSRLINHL